MNICMASNAAGSAGVSFHYDPHTLETWFETYAAVYTRDNGKKIITGHYDKYIFKTLKAAVKKFDALTEKYSIH